MAKPAPDRRFDDSPFSGMPSRRVNWRPPEPDDGSAATPGNGPFSPPPPRRRSGQPRMADDARHGSSAGRPVDPGTRTRPSASERFDRPIPTPPPLRRGRPPGDGYGDTHAELRWDTDRRLRPAYREGRDYLSPRDGSPRNDDRNRNGQGDRPPGRRDPFADPLRPSSSRQDREERRGGPNGRTPSRAAPDGEPPRGRNQRPVLADLDADGFDGDSTGSRMVSPAASGGPGGRMLAIAGVLFLAVSVVVASVGSMLNTSGDDGAPADGTEIAALTATRDQNTGVGAALDGTASADEPLVRFEDQALPTSTLPPAGQQEPGYAGPWVDGVQTVCIDPGHGGSDRGRTFAGDGDVPPLEEAVYTLQIADLLQDRLRAKGYVVVMTRTEDKDVNRDAADVNGNGKTAEDSDRDGTYDEIQARINVCNRANADLMISVHLNGYDSGKPGGFESWYTADRPFGAQSGVFAQLGVESIAKHFADQGYTPENRGAKDDGTYTVDDSDPTLAHNMLLTGPAIPGMITPSQMPGAIMENLFITNLNDIAFLRSANGTSVIADALFDAIDGYFSRFAS